MTTSALENLPDDRERTPANEPGMTRATGKLVVVAIATGACAYLCYLLLVPFLPALAWAITIAVVTQRYWTWLGSRFRSRNVQATVAVGTVGVSLLAPIVFLVYFAAAQIVDTVRVWRTPEYQQQWRQMLDDNPRLEEAWGRLTDNLDIQVAIGQVSEQVQSWATAVLSGVMATGFQALLAMFILFYLYRDREPALAAARLYSPLSGRETDYVLERLRDTMNATIFGSVVVALVQGALGGTIFALLGVPGAVLWGVVMGLLATIPYLGAFVVWGPAAVLLLISGHWIKASILAAWGVLIIGMVDNLLYPMLVGSRLKQHSVVAFIAIIGGLSLFGATGIVLGPVVVSLMFALLEIWRQRTRVSEFAA